MKTSALGRHFSKGLRRGLLAAILLLVAAWGVPRAADYTETIAAVVEDDPILLSDVMERYELLVAQGTVDSSDTTGAKTIQRQILDQLIEDKLLLLEASAQEIQVSEEEIGSAVQQTLDGLLQEFGSREAFLSQLEKEGLTEEGLRTQYREDARNQILASRLIGREIRSKTEVTDADVRTFFDENRDQIPQKPKLMRLSDIYISVRPDAAIENSRRQEAADVRNQILTGQSTFEKAAGLYSDDPSGTEGGGLGRFQKGDFDPAFENAAFALNVGEISQPVRTRFGYHLIRLDEVDPQGGWAGVHHILFGIPPTRADEARARQRADAVRLRISKGETFAAVAQTASDDTLSGARGGDLGWLPMEAFQGAVKQTMDTLAVGAISAVVPGDGGFHIMKITGIQEPGDYTFEEIKEDLKEMALRSKMEEMYRAWMETLREKFYVEVNVLGG